MKISIYNDSKEFGGHEIMTARLANALSRRHEVYFLFRNENFEKALSEGVNRIRIKLGPNWSYGGLGSYNIIDIVCLLRILRSIKPDLSIISQGLIELGLKCAWASKLQGIKTVSYIPLCFPLRSMGAGSGKIRDILGVYYYNLFNAFITVSEEQKSLIRSNLWGEKPIYVLDNFVDTEKALGNSVEQKSQGDVLKIGLIGRIVFAHKGQDKAVHIADQLRNRKIKFQFVVIGDGKDKDRLVDMINEKDLKDYFVFKGWLDNVKEIYSGIDVLLITSNFEGLPLVMLEALLLRIIVLAPDVGVFKEYLDDVFLYKEYSDAANALLNIDLLRKRFQETWEESRNTILKRHNAKAFEDSTIRIITDISLTGNEHA